MTIDTCVATLGIDGKLTKASVKKAFRQAALKHHPDARGSDTEFIRVKVAYDTLMALSSEELANYTSAAVPTSSSGSYDPFTDPDYDKRIFFTPENPNTEGFERKLRAKGCPYCHEFGFITKNTNPSKGFLGRERRLCKCQWA